jgi:hypothetical protein
LHRRRFVSVPRAHGETPARTIDCAAFTKSRTRAHLATAATRAASLRCFFVSFARDRFPISEGVRGRGGGRRFFFTPGSLHDPCERWQGPIRD